MSILEGSETKYSLSQVYTSLNYGRPMSAMQRRITRILLVVLLVFCAPIVVAFAVGIALGQWEIYTLFAVLLIVYALLIGIIFWQKSKFEKVERLIAECFDDVVEVDATMDYEPHVFNSGDNLLSYVVYFDIDGTEYAVTYQNPEINAAEKRKDLAFYNGKSFKALYSPSRKDVLILNPSANEEIV